MTMPTFGAGQRLYAEDLNLIARQVDSLTNPGWISYTPVWQSSGTAPTIGNGTITGRYRRAANSDLVIVEVNMLLGSTSTVGTGQYNWTLPVTASSSAVDNASGSGSWLRSASIRYPITLTVQTTTTFRAFVGAYANSATTINSRGGDMTTTAPIVPASGDTYTFTLQYDAA